MCGSVLYMLAWHITGGAEIKKSRLIIYMHVHHIPHKSSGDLSSPINSWTRPDHSRPIWSSLPPFRLLPKAPEEIGGGQIGTASMYQFLIWFAWETTTICSIRKSTNCKKKENVFPVQRWNTFSGNSLPHPDKGLEMRGWQTNPPTDLLTLENIWTEKDHF